MGGRTDVGIAQRALGFFLRLGHLVGLLGQVVDELFGCDCNGEGGVGGAGVDVFIGLDDLLDARDYAAVLIEAHENMRLDLRGSDTEPVMLAGRGMGLLLYGMAAGGRDGLQNWR